MERNRDLKIGATALIGTPYKKHLVSGLMMLDYYHHGNIEEIGLKDFLVRYRSGVGIWYRKDITDFKIVK